MTPDGFRLYIWLWKPKQINQPSYAHWTIITRCFYVVFDQRLNKCLSKQSRHRWFEMPSRALWRLCDESKWLYKDYMCFGQNQHTCGVVVLNFVNTKGLYLPLGFLSFSYFIFCDVILLDFLYISLHILSSSVTIYTSPLFLLASILLACISLFSSWVLILLGYFLFLLVGCFLASAVVGGGCF